MSDDVDDLDSVALDPMGVDVAPEMSGVVRDRWIYRAVGAVTVLPILIDAIRQGLAGWVPAGDSASTVFRAKSAFGIPPTLVGMVAAGASSADAFAYFPGPWQLWLLGGATRLLGTTWGPLLSMAVLNSFWILLAGWCVQRRLGYRTAIAVLTILGVLSWSLGNGMLHDPTPMIVIIPPFAAFVFIAWTLAAGDEGVLPALALVANFCFLDHLILTIVVPAITLASLGIWSAGLLWRRNRDRDRWPDLRRRSLRSFAWAVVITVVAWIPPVIEEFSNEPGNLTNLWHSWRTNPDSFTSTAGAFGMLMTIFSRWPWWLRGSLDVFIDPFRGITPASPMQYVVALIMVVAAVLLGWFAVRRRDRVALSAVLIAMIVLAVEYLNMVRSPGKLLLSWYYVGLWPVAAFVTFAFVLALARALPTRLRQRAFPVVVATAVLAAAANLPHTSPAVMLAGGTDPQVALAKELIPEVVAATREQGMVEPVVGPLTGSSPFTAIVLALADNGVPYCMTGLAPDAISTIDRCDPDRPVRQLTVYPTHLTDSVPANAQPIARASVTVDAADRRELERLTRRIRRAFAVQTFRNQPVELTRRAKAILDATYPDTNLQRSIAESIPERAPDELMDNPTSRWELARTIDYWARRSRAADVPRLAIIDLPGVSDDELLRWAELHVRWIDSDYTVAISPPDP